MSATPTYGVCAGCGAVAWELLQGISDYCLDCDGTAYGADDDDPCASCDCDAECEAGL